MPRLSSPDDQGRNGILPLSHPPSPGGPALSSKIKYASNVQDVASNVGSQLSSVLAIGLQLGTASPQFQQETDNFLLEDQEIGAGASVFIGLIASFIWFIKHRNSTKKQAEELDRVRKLLNPWWRRFKTLMALGVVIGSTGSETAFAFLPLPTWLKKPLKIIASYIFGLIFGVIGATFFNGKLTPNSKSAFMFGRDGWSKYAKAGILPGSLIGAAIGAVIGFLLPIPGGMALGMALGSGIGGIIGFVSFTFVIPLWNKITGKNAAGEKYRSQYIRTGTTFGMYIGTIIGFVVGLIIPFPGAAILCSTVGAGIGAAIGALVLGIFGPRISRKISKNDQSYSSWDYGARTGAMFGNQSGLGGVVNGFFNWFSVGTEHKSLKDVVSSIGALIFGLIGCLYDAFCAKKNQKLLDNAQAQSEGARELQAAQFEAKRPILSWSDQVRTFLTLGGFVGGIIGFIIGSALGGPVGGVIGAAIGTGLGGIISGGIGIKWGNAIYKGFVNSAKAIGNFFAPPTARNDEPHPEPMSNSSSASSLVPSSQDSEEESLSESPLSTPAMLRKNMPPIEEPPPLPTPPAPVIAIPQLSYSQSSHLSFTPLTKELHPPPSHTHLMEPEPSLAY